ncbi:MAG: PilZ domain-containing protein [Terracidiphilus sp.]
MAPFRGIPATQVPVPLDLIYLDAECRVIEAVEFFPTFQVSSSSAPASSVLALPVHSIYASHTQPGDQVAFGQVEQIEHELAQLFGPNASASVVQEALVTQVQEKPAVKSAPAPLPVLDRPIAAPAAPQPVQDASQAVPWKKDQSKPKSWLQRLLAPEPTEPRKTLRAALPDLAAYFWTGGTPQPHDIRNISPTGMFVVTDERWYPGTQVQMTLRKAEREGAGPEATISLLTRVKRWGNDGVGLEFVVRDPRASRTGEATPSEAIEREVLDQFLARIGHGKD